MTDLLNVDELSLSFRGGDPVVEGISFSVRSGEVVGLVGPSGSGKSLTTYALLGLLPPHVAVTHGIANYRSKSGETVDLLKRVERQLSVIRGHEIGLVFQEPQSALNPVLPCGRQLFEAVGNMCPRECRESRVSELLEQVGLHTEQERVLRALPDQLSGGQLQRLVIAMALAGRPRLLIADEPTTALDSLTEREIMLLLNRLRHDLGMGLLLISHDARLVSRLADREIRLGPVGRKSSVSKHGAAAGAGPVAARRAESDPVVSVEDLHIGFPDRAAAVVAGCSFEIRGGQWVGLLGPSGCGKSTVAGWLTGMVAARSGLLRGGGSGVPATAAGSVIRRMTGAQMIFQDVFGSLNPRMTVAQSISEVIAAGATDTVETLLRSVDLPPRSYANRLPDRLSGGERQRVAIARALAAAPRLLICDEALSGLDVELRREVQEVLQRECRSRDIAVLLITHDLETALECTDHVMLMEEGRIVERGDPRRVLRAPSSDLGRRFAETLL